MFWLTTFHFVQKKIVEHKKTDAAHETFIFEKRLLTGNLPLDATASGGFPFTSMFNFHFRDTKRGLFQPHGVACWPIKSLIKKYNTSFSHFSHTAFATLVFQIFPP